HRRARRACALGRALARDRLAFWLAMLFTRKQAAMVDADSALPGRSQEMPVPAKHEVLGTPLQGPFPPGVVVATFGMGCFWGAERLFWSAVGIYSSALDYSAGFTPHP